MPFLPLPPSHRFSSLPSLPSSIIPILSFISSFPKHPLLKRSFSHLPFLDSKILSWWDYGYQMSAMANRTVLVDNNTWNNTHIATVGA